MIDPLRFWEKGRYSAARDACETNPMDLSYALTIRYKNSGQSKPNAVNFCMFYWLQRKSARFSENMNAHDPRPIKDSILRFFDAAPQPSITVGEHRSPGSPGSRAETAGQAWCRGPSWLSGPDRNSRAAGERRSPQALRQRDPGCCKEQSGSRPGHGPSLRPPNSPASAHPLARGLQWTKQRYLFPAVERNPSLGLWVALGLRGRAEHRRERMRQCMARPAQYLNLQAQSPRREFD